MKNLLIIAQKVDEEDDLLGFFADWLRGFSNKFEKVFVITLTKGAYHLPANVEIYSLGKENNNPRILRLIKFYKLIFKLVPQTNGIFAHMSPIFAVAVWPAAFVYRKKIILWYLHRSVTFRLKIAEKLSYKIVTAARESLRLKSAKIMEIGHGINTAKFATQRNWTENQLKIISVGRISPIKNYETLLDAAKLLKDKSLNFEIKIIGQPVMAGDEKYLDFLKSKAGKLGLDDNVEFSGFVSHLKIPACYKEADLAVGLTPDGGIDKTILEAMAAGCIVLTSNKINRKYFGSYGDRLIFEYRNSEDLAQKIGELRNSKDKKEISAFMVDSVKKNHDLAGLVNKISNLFQ